MPVTRAQAEQALRQIGRELETAFPVKITKNCPTCRKELHLVQDNTGSAWYHANGAEDYKCWTQGGGDGAR